MNPWQRWKQTTIANQLMVITTAIVAFGTLFYVGVAIFQYRLMKDSASQSSEQTDKLIAATQRMAETTIKAFEEAKRSNKEISERAERALQVSRDFADAATIQAKTSKTSAEAAVAAQRPWISVDVRIEEPLLITEQEVRIGLTFTITNSGNSPAVNTRVIPQLAAIPIRDGLDFETAIRKALKISNNWSRFPNRIGRTIPPKRKSIERHVVQLPRSEILEVVSSSDEADPNRVILNLGGCIDYDFGTGKGQTSFCFVLMERGTNHMGIEIRPHAVAIDQVVLQEQNIGVYAK